MFRFALFILLLVPLQSFSQQKECVFIEWSKHYGGAKNDAAQDVQRTTDGGFIVAGSSRSQDQDLSGNLGSADYWVVKLDSLGVLAWQRNYGGSDNDFATGVLQTTDGGFIVVGGTVSFDGDVNGNHGAEDAWVIRLNALGNVVWKKTFGGTLNDRAESINPTSDGGFIVAGYSQSDDGDLTDNKGEFDYWVFKINLGGDLIWQKNLGGSLSEYAFDAIQTGDGGFLVTGSSFSTDGDVGANNGFYDYWFAKLSPTGQIEWTKNYGGSNEERAYAITVTTDGAIIAGSSTSTGGDLPANNGGFDFWALKIDLLGDVVWSKNLGGNLEDRALGIWAKPDGGALVVGHSNSAMMDVGGNYGSKDGWMVNLSPDGQIIWEKNFGGTADDRLSAVIQLPEGGFACAGFSTSSDFDLDGNNGEQDFWVVKLLPDSLEFDLGPDTILCAGEGLLLNTAISGITYNWSDGTNLPVYLVTSPGYYWLEIDKQGCKSRDTILVDYVSETPLDLGNDTTLCQGETLLLNSQIPGADVLWNDGSNQQTLAVQVPGSYWIELYKDGCGYQDTIQVSFTEVPFDLGEDLVLCEGDSQLLSVGLQDADFLWQDGSTAASYMVNSPGLFWVEVAQGGCSRTDSLTAIYQIGPTNPLPDYGFICENQGLWLNASFEGASYLWQDGSTGHNFKAVAPGTYAVAVEINGCIFEDEVHLRPCEECLFVPNVFSPNGDGINDEFRGFPGCEISNYQIFVYDRWGNLVFENDTPQIGWDGEIDGKKSSQSSFTYRIEFDYESDEELLHQTRRGSVILVR